MVLHGRAEIRNFSSSVEKCFTNERSERVKYFFNTRREISLREGFIPPLLKSACVRPLPKKRPAQSVNNDIRPISLTCQISKVMEGLTLSRLAPSVLADLDAKQFATPGKSTEQAIAYILHLLLENLDRGNCSARLFCADFRKAFD